MFCKIYDYVHMALEGKVISAPYTHAKHVAGK